jgi:hypothetical protein
VLTRRGGRRPAFTGLATQPYSATEVDGWQHKLSRVSQRSTRVSSIRSEIRTRLVALPKSGIRTSIMPGY